MIAAAAVGRTVDGRKGDHMSMMKEFKEFAVKGNAVDLAIGFVLGGAFAAVINSLVNDIIMPPIGAALGGADFSQLYVLIKEGTGATAPYASLAAATEAGAVTLNYGMFINVIINFLIIAWALFMVVKAMNRLRKPEVEEQVMTKDCPFCASTIPLAATKCPACTSDLPE